MKRLIFALGVLMLLVTANMQAQGRTTYASSTNATSTWDSLGFDTKVSNVIVSDDRSSGAETLYVALNNDTTSAHRFPLKAGEVLTLEFVAPRWVRTRSSGASIHRRVLAW